MCVGADDDVRQVVAEILPGPRVGRGHHRPHHHLGEPGAGAGGGRRGAWLRLSRRAGLRRPGGRGEGPAVDHGRRATRPRSATAEPVLRAYAKAVRHMGGPGAGQLTKMVNQICIAGVVQGLAEAVSFAARAGLDPDLTYQADFPGRGPVVADG